jgi:hypothetical protein
MPAASGGKHRTLDVERRFRTGRIAGDGVADRRSG